MRSIWNKWDNPIVRLLIKTVRQGDDVKPLSFLRYKHLSMFSQPVCDRAIYGLIRKHRFRSFIEIGLEDGNRCENMIRVAKKFGVSPNVRYTGIDQFDARSGEQQKLSLIEMHRKLKSTNTKSQLVPGNIRSSIARIANSHVRTDLIVISAGFDEAELAASWFYFPRMLHSGSLVLIQRQPGAAFERMNRLEVEKFDVQHSPKSSAAA